MSIKKSILCKLGLHSTFIDAAYFSSALCCNHCGTYTNKSAGKLLAKERELFKAAANYGMGYEESLNYVARNLCR